jgi:hypothetical protein
MPPDAGVQSCISPQGIRKAKGKEVMRQHMPGDMVLSSPFEEFGTGIPVFLSKGGSRDHPRSKTGPVTVKEPGHEDRVIPPYPDAKLMAIIEDGLQNPRPIPPGLLDRTEAARVACKEDQKILETQFAGIGVSGTFGSLDGRSRRRPTKGKTEDQK